MPYNNKLRFIVRDSNKLKIYNEDKKLIKTLDNDVMYYEGSEFLVATNTKVYSDDKPDVKNQRNKKAVINANGDILIDYKYDRIIPIVKDSKYSNLFILKTEYEDENDIKYETVNPHDEEYYQPKTISKYEVADINGNIITNQMYDDVCDLENGCLAVCLNYKWGIINENGKVVFPIKYNKSPSCFKFNNKFYYTINDKKNRIIKDDKLKDVFNENNYKIIKPLNKQYVMTQKDYKYGLIDVNSNIKAKPIYDSITNKSDNGFIILKKDKENTICDEKGKTVFINKSKVMFSFRNGLSFTQNGFIAKFIDEKGETVIPNHISRENQGTLSAKCSTVFKTPCYKIDSKWLVVIKGIFGKYIIKI